MQTCKLRTPIPEVEIRRLKVNDIVYITGKIVTARDQAHKRALEYATQNKPLPLSLEGLALFHCGPVISRRENQWVVVAAGPTTSMRMEQYEADFIQKFKVRIIIGKGGMGEKTSEALAKYGAVYCAFTGGAGVLAAKAIKRVASVDWLDLGIPEALWVFEVEEFGPLLVAIDTWGNNLFIDITEKATVNRQRIFHALGI
ncbi:MAG: FumA C-terminus/TtdB family hydratase beta subunit [Candidatus Bathyarchaeia archaeon]